MSETITKDKVTLLPEEARALLEIIQRAPATKAELLFIEMLFARWHNELKPQNEGSTPNEA